MKQRRQKKEAKTDESRPRGGVWIETIFALLEIWRTMGHAPAGACGLKRRFLVTLEKLSEGHAPAGACGLKLVINLALLEAKMSRPRGGVWIETGPLGPVSPAGPVTPPRGRVD